MLKTDVSFITLHMQLDRGKYKNKGFCALNYIFVAIISLSESDRIIVHLPRPDQRRTWLSQLPKVFLSHLVIIQKDCKLEPDSNTARENVTFFSQYVEPQVHRSVQLDIASYIYFLKNQQMLGGFENPPHFLEDGV